MTRVAAPARAACFRFGKQRRLVLAHNSVQYRGLRSPPRVRPRSRSMAGDIGTATCSVHEATERARAAEPVAPVGGRGENHRLTRWRIRQPTSCVKLMCNRDTVPNYLFLLVYSLGNHAISCAVKQPDVRPLPTSSGLRARFRRAQRTLPRARSLYRSTPEIHSIRALKRRTGRRPNC